MSSATLIPPVFDINKSEAFYVSATISYVLAVVAVALRFWSRKLMKARIWVDDWVVALALVRYQDRVYNSDCSLGADFPISSSLLGSSSVQPFVSWPRPVKGPLIGC